MFLDSFSFSQLIREGLLILLCPKYIQKKEINRAREHALKAIDINPDFDGPIKLLDRIEIFNRE